MECETTVALVFGAEYFDEFYSRLKHRHHTEESLDVYTCKQTVPDTTISRSVDVVSRVHNYRNKNVKVYKYRELKRSLEKDDGTRYYDTTWDRKSTQQCIESQIPYIDKQSHRVIFVSSTYKSSFEEKLSASEWELAVREDHATAACIRTSNKMRCVFPPQSFGDIFNGRVPNFTRLSLGEYSTYAGTLEARSKCNPIYYLEIEHEKELDVKDVANNMLHLVGLLFEILPYELVARAMRKTATSTVQRERTDNIFDDFKRQFADYNKMRDQLWKSVGKLDEDDGDGDKRRNTKGTNKGAHEPPFRLFLMPKWDGIKATANYCDGHIFIKDQCGSLSTYSVDLPFDNDLLLQLEIVEDADTKERFIVITEILAVVVTNHNTLYHVYSKNNSLYDTGRCAGNVSNSITMKKQFRDPKNICNTYRLVEPLHSLLIIHHLSVLRWSQVWDSQHEGRKQKLRFSTTATNTYMTSDSPTLFLTTVVRTSVLDEIKDVLRILDQFHCYTDDGSTSKRVRPQDYKQEKIIREECLRTLSKNFPEPMLTQLQERYINRLCEGLLVAIVFQNGRHRPLNLPDHFYIKLKMVDTIDLEYNITLGFATTASGKHKFQVQGVPTTFPGWVERASPITNDRAIIECYYDRQQSSLIFVKDRPDKTRPDSDEKISAIDGDIIEKCAQKTEFNANHLY